MIHLQTPKKSTLFPQQSNQPYSATRDTSSIDGHSVSFSNNSGVTTSSAKFSLPPLSSILSSAKSNHYKDHPLTNITNTANSNTSAVFAQTPCKKLPSIDSFTSTPLTTATTPYVYQPPSVPQQHPHLQHRSSFQYHYPNASRSASSSLPRPSPPPPPQPQPTVQHFNSYITYQPVTSTTTTTATNTATHSNVSSSSPTPPPSASTSSLMSSRKRSSSIADEDTSIMDTSILELRKSKSKPRVKSISTSPTSTSPALSASTSTTAPSSANSSDKLYAFISHSPATFPSQEPDIDNAPLARRKRRRTSPHELNILNREFELGSTPNKSRRIEIAKVVQMTEKAVQIWFQNKRQALRKQSNVEKEICELPPTDVPIEQQLEQQQQHQPTTPSEAVVFPIVSSTPTKPTKSNLSIMIQ
ncbi:YOX1 [Candida margitis]|uniref:YOX1 n=1 Tax=Candida margitis TaxID=1775924 RepID=UPI0022276962|nr:YOX1 [Candida margitis]KAI5958160.1 YOX1 [Candida margitis]